MFSGLKVNIHMCIQILNNFLIWFIEYMLIDKEVIFKNRNISSHWVDNPIYSIKWQEKGKPKTFGEI